MRTLSALALAAASLVVLALPAEAQWNVERRSGNAIAVATGLDGQIEVGISCQGNDQVIELTLPGATFRNGDVEVQWDDGSTEQYGLAGPERHALGIVGIDAGEDAHCEAPPAQHGSASRCRSERPGDGPHQSHRVVPSDWLLAL